MEGLKKFARWYWQTAALVGCPTLLLLLIMGFDKTLSTGACYVGGWQCDRAINAVPSNIKVEIPGWLEDEEDSKPAKRK